MKIVKCLTANLEVGMTVAEGAYTYNNHLVIQSNTTLTQDIIDKLKYYAVRSVKIYVPEEGDESSEQATSADTTQTEDTITSSYYERIHETTEFKEFETQFHTCVMDLKDSLNELVSKSADGLVDHMLENVRVVLSKSRNPLHLLDMMRCMRNYDDMTYTHSLNVALICNVIGSWLNYPAEEMQILMTAGLLHDIGKLRIPAHIIQKPDKLTDEEFKQIQMHPQYGYDILYSKNLDQRIKTAALQHHERLDGSGYPSHRKGSGIEEIASIVAIADVYDAMTADRVYRKGMCPFPVLEHMERDKDKYNPTVLYTFIERSVEAYLNTKVMLNNGEEAKVVLLNKSFFSRPVVISDTNTYDLSKDLNIQITTLL